MSSVPIIVHTEEVRRAFALFKREQQRETRRELAGLSREVRDDIRGDWPRGPAQGGHSFRAVTSGTNGATPTVRLNRDYRAYVGWLVFGGRRKRDRTARYAPQGGYWFYPGIARARREMERRVAAVLLEAIRRADLDRT